jgi:NADP-dependent 3-hydroxy acid dehydrogenase YdfG
MNSAPSVLLSGCSSGIGKALAVEFASRNCNVIATARKPETFSELQHPNIKFLQLDVTDTASIQRCINDALALNGRIDILVNNAGFGLMGPLAEVGIGDLRSQFETNVIGLVALTQAALPAMMAQKRGLIVNIGSISGVFTTPFAGAYCSSKAAVHSISDAMRIELAPFGIRVVTIQPGAIQSHFGQTAARSIDKFRSDSSQYNKYAAFIEQRAFASQQGATSAEALAVKVVDTLLSPNPPSLIRIGKKSILLPLLQRILPQSLQDAILARQFGL